ncbi:MAG: penicillin-binding protein 2 [Clostridiales bacterium]|nr:penicillin-binding protein 2 [Clostridiales bacterium]
MIIGAVVCIIVIFAIRLFYLQIVDSDYKNRADNNAFLNKTLYPARGVIYDRNDNLLVYNQSIYEVMLIMSEVQPFDTLDFCRTLDITLEDFDRRILEIKDRKLNPGYSAYTPQLFMNQLSVNESGIFQEKLYKFPGFYVQTRPVRNYGFPNAPLVLGYIGEVGKRDIERDNYYVQGDYSGQTGVERSYEHILRGEKGIEILLRDAQGRIKGKYEEGIHDKTPVPGKNLKLAIDIELQAYAELLMRNKTGSVVMIEPETGEILCMVSSPAYNPNLFVGRQRGNNFSVLNNDPRKPLMDRAIMGTYSPGSTFKPAQGLVFLQEGIITPQKMYTCSYGYPLGWEGRPKCHQHASPLNLIAAIATSCNAYFCWGLHDMLDSNRRRYGTVQEAYTVWRNLIISLGFGTQLGIDLPSESRGYIPNSQFYDERNRGRWSSGTIISNAIGQGEITATPLQICNLAAIIANRGYYIPPHAVKEIEGGELDSTYTTKKWPAIDSQHYDAIVEGMRNAVLFGTCTGLYMNDVEVCGKTGTVENARGRDHSACIAFAPYNKPKVAISVFVENGGWGATISIPIARLMLEKYFFDEVKPESQWREESVLNTVIIPSNV